MPLPIPWRSKKMIEKTLYKQLEKQWEKEGEIYQTWSRIEKRMPTFLKHIEHLTGKDVLELGCNAGIYGYEIAKVARSYFGVDATEHYIRQARITKLFIENPNVDFWHGRVMDFVGAMRSTKLRVPFNALFASFLMYHLSNKEIRSLSEYVIPQCDVVVLPVRTKKRKIWRIHNFYFFYKPENIVKYLEAQGFRCEINWGDEAKKFAVIIGVRN